MKLIFSFCIALVATSSMAQEKLHSGLKDVLRVGLENAVTQVALKDGYYGNDLIKIPLPEKLQKGSKYLDKLGGGLTDKLVERMNRAAEQAAPQAKEIFLQAVKDIRFDDATKLLSGEEHALTTYLQESTSDSLKEAFYPVVKQSMEELKVIALYNEYTGKLKANPFAKKIDLDITSYVTEKALTGLFVIVADEEAKMRTDPKARVTDLIKDVFSNLGK